MKRSYDCFFLSLNAFSLYHGDMEPIPGAYGIGREQPPNLHKGGSICDLLGVWYLDHCYRGGALKDSGIENVDSQSSRS